MDEKPSIGAGKPFPPSLPDSDKYTVEFESMDDPLRPRNWSPSKKYGLIVSEPQKLSLALIAMEIPAMVSSLVSKLIIFASAIFAPGIDSASKAFGVGTEVGSLGTTLYVLGFVFGPLLWAPISEIRGRKWRLTVSMLIGGLFTIASAVAKDVQALIICRFFAGVCGACQLSVVPAVTADVYDNEDRGVALAVYSLTVFGGPFIAPFAGGFAASSYLGWRWTLYIPAILSLTNGAVFLLFLQESFAPCLLIWKAAAIRKATDNWGIHAKQEEVELDMAKLADTYFTRPLKLLFTEPIILAVSLYMSFIYGLVYALLEAYPIVFEQIHGMRPGVAGLTFIGLFIGNLLALGFILSQHATYKRKLLENKNVPVPEWRLWPTMLGAPVFTVGLFWFGWTGFSSTIHWAAPAAAGIFIGFGALCIFFPCFNYLVDVYLPLTASAVAANIMLRSLVAAGFPLFTRQMFETMGVQWACTLLGCLAAAMIPIPFVFRAYGPWLREKSKGLSKFSD
ncbi:hypothetical protein MMC07_002684 [Pseudocyphellaria aurata]|nr:hypothetical protein [Pseudocyphellaria aurata]